VGSLPVAKNNPKATVYATALKDKSIHVENIGERELVVKTDEYIFE
jgi:hypothetical protein